MLPRILTLLLLLTSIARAQTAPAITLADAKELNPRTGLPNVGARIKYHNTDLQIAFLGGSLTQANEGYRSQLMDLLKQKYPDAKFQEIPAAVPGTGSTLGVFRVQESVLNYRPDLVLVELAIHDMGVDPQEIEKSLEGLVRQIWKSDNTTDIVFLYPITESTLKALQDGKCSVAVSLHEKIAAHYGIPTIHFGPEIAQQIADNKLVIRSKEPVTEAEKKALNHRAIFSYDGVYPLSNTGHALYAEVAFRNLATLLNTGKVGPHKVPKPLQTGNYENAKLVSPESPNVTLSKGWTKLPGTHPTMLKFNKSLQNLFVASTAGESISFKFKGSYVGLLDIIGPDTNQITVTIDNEPTKLVPRFDGYCTYQRINNIPLATGLSNEVHTVTLTLPKEQISKIPLLKEKGNLITAPDLYLGHNIYISRIMLIGDIVP